MGDNETVTEEENDQQMTDTTCPAPAKTLADLRREAGLTQRQVAHRMGVNERRVGHIEARYPHLRFDTLSAYLHAIDRQVYYIGISGSDVSDVAAHQLSADPATARTRAYLKEAASATGAARLAREASAAKELVLQGQTPQPSGDPTGRDIDHPDPESDQGDEGHGQSP